LAEHTFLHALDTLYQSGATYKTLESRDRASLIGMYLSSAAAGGAVPGRPLRPSLMPYHYSYPKEEPQEAPMEEVVEVVPESETASLTSTLDEESLEKGEKEPVNGAAVLPAPDR
jgi:hypothetical protein